MEKTITASPTGFSMHPLIKEHSKLTFTPNPKTLNLSDIVIFSYNQKLTAHRIIKIKQKNSQTLYFLKADNKTQPDGWFTQKQILGKLTRIHYPSYTIDLTTTKNRLLAYLFLLYSHLNHLLPFLIKLKTLSNLSLFKSLYRNLLQTSSPSPSPPSNFPNTPTQTSKIKQKINRLARKLKKHQQNPSPSYPTSTPHELSTYAWKKLLPFNPNNLGNWTTIDQPKNPTGKLEKKLLHQLMSLYHTNPQETTGYLTSGGTEANILSAWIGRKYLTQTKAKQKLILLQTPLTHYSIKKAADIVNINTHTLPLDPKTWSIDQKSLEKNIKNLAQKGYQGFLIPLTLGYPLTGTSDSIPQTTSTLKKLQKQLEISTFTWIDAASNGLTRPFLDTNFTPFKNQEIQTFLADFHKLGFTQIPSGIILFRQNLLPLIQSPVPYLSQNDNTLLGSRSGITPVATWTTIQSLGRSGFRKKLSPLLQKKYSFLQKLKKYPQTKTISNKYSLNLAIITKNQDLKKHLKSQNIKFHSLTLTFPQQTKKLKLATVYFTPQTSLNLPLNLNSTQKQTISLIKNLQPKETFQTTVQTKSMKPTLSQGEKVTITKKSFRTIKKDDIIAFNPPNSDKIFLHRVIQTNPKHLTTKGDNNPKKDPWKITKEHYLGTLSNF